MNSQQWQIVTGIGFGFLFLVSIFIVVKRRGTLRRLFTPDFFHDCTNQFRSVNEMYSDFTKRRSGDFFDRWSADLAARMRTSGMLAAGAQGMWDILTLGGSARRRARANELNAAAYIAQSIENIGLHASENLRQSVASTATRIDHAFKLLRKAQKITNPLLRATPNSLSSPLIVQHVSSLDKRTQNLIGRHSEFVAIAIAAGAGAATAAGLWGAVQVAGYASTGAAMTGLYGAAAHSAGWAWFGGGSLATGGGGMALGHVILPGVGIAVAWGTLVAQLHRAANEIEKQIIEIERWNDTNMLVLTDLLAVEERYRKGANDFRLSLEDLHHYVTKANRKLRPFGVLSDFKRRRRSNKGVDYYSLNDLRSVEDVVRSVEGFLRNLPASHISQASSAN